jgi:hypothetical protein
MLVTVENSARKLIKQYAADAVFIAMDRLNRSIDQRDFHARDFWAQVFTYSRISAHGRMVGGRPMS